MDTAELGQCIDRLASLFARATSGNSTWKEVWTLVAEINQDFKATTFPSAECRQDEWKRFQGIIFDIRSHKDTADRNRANFRHTSENVATALFKQINNAISYDPSNADLAQNVLELVLTGGLRAFGEPTITSEKEMLLVRSRLLKAAWDDFGKEKARLTSADKSQLFSRLKDAQGILDTAWEKWKDKQERYFQDKRAKAEIRKAETERRHKEYLERRRIRDERERNRLEKHTAWRVRIEENIDKNVERVNRLYQVLRSKAEHRDRFISNRDGGRSAEFRAAMADKVSSISEDIDSIQAKIDELESYIAEDKQKLRNA